VASRDSLPCEPSHYWSPSVCSCLYRLRYACLASCEALASSLYRREFRRELSARGLQPKCKGAGAVGQRRRGSEKGEQTFTTTRAGQLWRRTTLFKVLTEIFSIVRSSQVQKFRVLKCECSSLEGVATCLKTRHQLLPFGVNEFGSD
jgi:hypothetical protein